MRESVLKGILARPDAPGREIDEALGLMGPPLQAAIRQREPGRTPASSRTWRRRSGYYSRLRPQPREEIWQGINYVALLAGPAPTGCRSRTGQGEEAVLAEVEHS